ncbi:MAG: PqqD family protein [Synergistaceae bacterium]|nr:PqqD family protein [Synergistaceae bacterium]
MKDEFLTHTSGGEAYLVPSGNLAFRGLVKGNETLGEVIGFLKTDTTETQIVKNLRKKYDAPAGTIEFDVRKAVEVLRSVGALIE